MDEKKLILNNREVGLYYCLGAARELAELCGGLEKISDYLNGDAAEVMSRAARVILILNKWWCKAAACNGTQVEPITAEELDLYMDPAGMVDYMGAVAQAIEQGTKRTVKTKPIPVKQKNVTSGRKQSS